MAKLPQEIELRVGETTDVPLARSGGGYRWFSEVSGDTGAVDVQIAYAEGDLVEGRWRGEVATVRGVSPGHAALHFELRREWEDKPAGPQKTNDDARTIDVTVVGA
jgi:hypothetical protein